MTILPVRTFWDKVVIAHGLRRWFERRGMLRQAGERVSRHYYDLYCMLRHDAGRQALSDIGVAADCVAHARMFFDRPDYDLASAKPGSFAIHPTTPMIAPLRRDYENTRAMIFGEAPDFHMVLDAVAELDAMVNDRNAGA